MIDAKIIAGLAVFTGLATGPVWYGRKTAPPELAKAQGQCVEPVAFMRAQHMQLLDRWRNAVVRNGEPVYVASDGRHHDMSLTGTCLKCHGEAEQFCNRCHEYAGVEAFCWDCHQQHQRGMK